jgi:hypothetical protein
LRSDNVISDRIDTEVSIEGSGLGALLVEYDVIECGGAAPWWYHMELPILQANPPRYSQRSRIYEYRRAGTGCGGLELWALVAIEWRCSWGGGMELIGGRGERVACQTILRFSLGRSSVFTSSTEMSVSRQIMQSRESRLVSW